MELKPLYLAAGRGWQISHEERALRVQCHGRAPAWYPFRRVCRIISATDVDWRPSALIACLRAGIPITFTDAHGEPQGYCYGARRREATLDQLLRLALDHPEWEERYRHWHNGITRQCILDTGKTLGTRLRSLDPETAHSGFCNHHYLRTGRRVAPLLRALEGPIHALAAARLVQTVSARRLGHPHPGLCIVAEFAGLLRWAAHRSLHFMDVELLDGHGPAHTAAILLATCPEVEHELGVLLHRFELWLRSWAA